MIHTSRCLELWWAQTRRSRLPPALCTRCVYSQQLHLHRRGVGVGGVTRRFIFRGQASVSLLPAVGIAGVCVIVARRTPAVLGGLLLPADHPVRDGRSAWDGPSCRKVSDDGPRNSHLTVWTEQRVNTPSDLVQTAHRRGAVRRHLGGPSAGRDVRNRKQGARQGRDGTRRKMK